jgi:hypothetical protein
LQPKPDPRTSEPATLVTQLTPSSQLTALKSNARYVRVGSVFVVLRSMTDAVPVLTLISSSSAHFGAAHGDPRLPNLKRRLPEGNRKKKQLRRQVATVRTIDLFAKAQRGCAQVQEFYTCTISMHMPVQPRVIIPQVAESEFTIDNFSPVSPPQGRRLHCIRKGHNSELRSCFIRLELFFFGAAG